MQLKANDDYEALVEAYKEFPNTCRLMVAVVLMLVCYLLAEILTSAPMMVVGAGFSALFRKLFNAVASLARYFCIAAKWVYDGVCVTAECVGDVLDFVQSVICWPFVTVWVLYHDVVDFAGDLSRTAKAKASEASAWLWAKFCAGLVCLFVCPALVVKVAGIRIAKYLVCAVWSVFKFMVVFPVKWVCDTVMEIITLGAVLVCAAVKALFILLLVPFNIALWMQRVGSHIVWTEFCSQLDRLHQYIAARNSAVPTAVNPQTTDSTYRFKNLYYLLVAGGLALAWWWIVFFTHMTVLYVTEFDCVLYITGHRWTADITFMSTANVAANFAKNAFMDELKRNGIMRNAVVQECVKLIKRFISTLLAPFARHAGDLYGMIVIPDVAWPAVPALPAWPSFRTAAKAVKVRKL